MIQAPSLNNQKFVDIVCSFYQDPPAFKSDQLKRQDWEDWFQSIPDRPLRYSPLSPKEQALQYIFTTALQRNRKKIMTEFQDLFPEHQIQISFFDKTTIKVLKCAGYVFHSLPFKIMVVAITGVGIMKVGTQFYAILEPIISQQSLKIINLARENIPGAAFVMHHRWMFLCGALLYPKTRRITFEFMLDYSTLHLDLARHIASSLLMTWEASEFLSKACFQKATQLEMSLLEKPLEKKMMAVWLEACSKQQQLVA